MVAYGLIGHPLTHSFSPNYFRSKFETEGIEASYNICDILSVAEIETFLATTPWLAFNVTIPYKEHIMSFMDIITPPAEIIGAVNTVVRKNNLWYGYNTDYIGFEETLLEMMAGMQGEAMVFGNGGAAKAVKYVLHKHQIPFTLVTRNALAEGILYEDLQEDHFNKHHLLINTTPVGMFPNIDQMLPIPLQFIKPYHRFIDLIYNPPQTVLMKHMAARGAKICNGYAMLVAQAEAAYALFPK